MGVIIFIGLILFLLYLVYGGSENAQALDHGVFNFEEPNPELIPFAVVLDVETTGLINMDGAPTKAKLDEWDEGFPRIVQFAWITVSRDYRAVKKKNFIIKQDKPIPNEAVAIHGITNEKAESLGVDLKEVLIEFRNDIEFCEYYVGHNVQFDKYVVEAECIRSRVAKPFTKKGKYDTMVMGRSIMERKFYKLQEIAQKTLPKDQFEKIDFHDAEHDVYVTAALFCALHKAGLKY